MSVAISIRDILPLVSKPGRYVGNEWNVIKKDLTRAEVRVALSFPDVYEVGMSHLGLRILYEVLNKTPGVACERVFAPWHDMEFQMRQRQIPLFSLESFYPVSKFDILGFSLEYEMCYTNILNMLDLAGIPLESKERGREFPLIIAGGPCAFNPEPLADFIDLFVLGEGEEVILEILDVFKKNKGYGRGDMLSAMASIPGVYVPSLYEVSYHEDGSVRTIAPKTPAAPMPVRKRIIRDLNVSIFPERPLVPHTGIIHDRLGLEIMRGCGRGCRFCQAGVIYRPVRERSAECIMRLARGGYQASGYEEISLISLSSGDYSGLKELVPGLVELLKGKGVSISMPSLRVNGFWQELPALISGGRKTTFTFAPEAGSIRLRRFINKDISDEELFKSAESAFRAGYKRVKLYFMLGLPTENEEDLNGIVEVSEKVSSIRRAIAGGPAEVAVSVSSFVPKSHTPFQWEPMEEETRLRAKQDFIKKKVRNKKVSFSFPDVHLSILEGVFSRGDRRLGNVLKDAWKRGAKFDGWSEHFNFSTWQDAFRGCGIEAQFYLRRRPKDEVLPWDHIDPGIKKETLWQIYQSA